VVSLLLSKLAHAIYEFESSAKIRKLEGLRDVMFFDDVPPIDLLLSTYRNEVVGMVLVDSIHPAEWENPTPKQLRISEVSLRYAWIAAWLARLGAVRFCRARLARGSPRLGWAAVSAFGFDTAAAAQRIVGEIRKLPAPILPVVRALWSQPKNFISLGQHVVALPVSAAQAAAVSSLRDLPLVVLSGEHHAAPYTQWQRELAQLSSRGRHVVAIDRAPRFDISALTTLQPTGLLPAA